MFASVINTVVPIFGLIFLGWACSKGGLLDGAATDALNRFVVYLALPALLFSAMAGADLDAMAEMGFVASFGIGTLMTMGIYLLVSRRQGLEYMPRMINCLSVAYSNSGYMGIPLILLVFGTQGLPIAVIGAVMTVVVQFSVIIIAIEAYRARGRSLLPALRKIIWSLMKNPILVSTALGVAVSALEISLPSGISSGIEQLSKAATPCALLTIGMFIAQTKARGGGRAVTEIVLLKLFVHPLLVGVFAFFVFDLDPMWAWCAVLSTALPVGTGSFMLAHLYQQDAATSARSILVSTVGSVVTLTALLVWMNILGIA